MNKLSTNFPVLVVALAFSGCATSLSKGGEMVLTFTGPAPKECKFLGSVGAYQSDTWISKEESGISARNKALNEVAKRGGNWMNVSFFGYGPSHAETGGSAYMCPEGVTLPFDSAQMHLWDNYQYSRPVDFSAPQRLLDQWSQENRRPASRKTNCTSTPQYDSTGRYIRDDVECETR